MLYDPIIIRPTTTRNIKYDNAPAIINTKTVNLPAYKPNNLSNNIKPIQIIVQHNGDLRATNNPLLSKKSDGNSIADLGNIIYTSADSISSNSGLGNFETGSAICSITHSLFDEHYRYNLTNVYVTNKLNNTTGTLSKKKIDALLKLTDDDGQLKLSAIEIELVYGMYYPEIVRLDESLVKNFKNIEISYLPEYLNYDSETYTVSGAIFNTNDQFIKFTFDSMFYLLFKCKISVSEVSWFH